MTFTALTSEALFTACQVSNFQQIKHGQTGNHHPFTVQRSSSPEFCLSS